MNTPGEPNVTSLSYNPTNSIMFGYPTEPDFDLAEEERISRLKRLLSVALVLCCIYLFSGLPQAVQVFQGCVATGLGLGDSFYVRRRNLLARPWLWKAVLVAVPLHVVYLAVLFWFDKVLPHVMTKSIIFMPILAAGFGIESLLIDRIVGYFEPPRHPSDGQALTPVV